MVRNIVGFVVGYVVMGLLVAAGFIVGPLTLGIDRVIAPGTYQATTLWLWVAVGIGLVGAIAGGAACRAVARSRTPGYALMAFVLIAGAAMGFMRPTPQAPVPPRPAGQSALEVLRDARQHGREPLFTKITNPVAGALGVLLGMVIVDRRRSAAPR